MNSKKTITVTVIAIAICLTFALVGCGGGDTESSEIAFETVDLDGNDVKSNELFEKNKITMINMWGTYCGPCIEEMPELEKISKDYADKGVEVVGLLTDVTTQDNSKIGEAQKILKLTGATFMNLKSWDGYENHFAAPGTPTTFFVDSQGYPAADPVVGADVEEYRNTLDQLLQQ